MSEIYGAAATEQIAVLKADLAARPPRPPAPRQTDAEIAEEMRQESIAEDRANEVCSGAEADAAADRYYLDLQLP